MKRKGDNSNQGKIRTRPSPLEELPKPVKQVLVTQIGALGSVGMGLLTLSMVSQRLQASMDTERMWRYAVDTDFAQVPKRKREEIRHGLEEGARPYANPHYKRLPSKHMWMAMRHAFGFFLSLGLVTRRALNQKLSRRENFAFNTDLDLTSGKILVTGVYQPRWIVPQPFSFELPTSKLTKEDRNALDRGRLVDDLLEISIGAKLDDSAEYEKKNMYDLAPVRLRLWWTSRDWGGGPYLNDVSVSLDRTIDETQLYDLFLWASENIFTWIGGNVPEFTRLLRLLSAKLIVQNPILRVFVNSERLLKSLEEARIDYRLDGFDFYKEIPRDTETGKLQIGCSVCGNQQEDQLRHCGGCHKVLYCSKRCQTADWELHQHTCAK